MDEDGLPGFMPGAVFFALRTTAALLLAYYVSFLIQLDIPSSAGVCVAIVAQPTQGMALSKSLWRVAGTLIGGVASIVFVACFPQDRTMLLAAFVIWLGGCSFVASLLRDFRAYGAVLAGYTVGIVAIASIDSPDDIFIVAANRVAAILIGIGAVGLMNGLTIRRTARVALLTDLRAYREEAVRIVKETLSGQPPPDSQLADFGLRVLALHATANHAATELPDGGRRRDGARQSIAALLGIIAAVRAVAGGLETLPDRAAVSRIRTMFLQVLGTGTLPPLAPPANPTEAFFLERSLSVLSDIALVDQGIGVLETGWPRVGLDRVLLHHDYIGAGLNAARTMMGTSCGVLFCIYGNWSGATLMLVQQSAMTALFGMQPDPSAAAVNMAWTLPFAALAAGVVDFLLLPSASTFTQFSIAVGTAMFGLALLGRHKRLVQFGPGLMLFFTLLLTPSNVQSFDLTQFLGNVQLNAMAILLMVLTFNLILPVSPRRRVARIAAAITADLRRTILGKKHGVSRTQALTITYDRLGQAAQWLGREKGPKQAVLDRLFALAHLDLALRRAGTPKLPAGESEVCMAQELEQRAREIFTGPVGRAELTASSGLHGAAALLRQQGHALRLYGATGR